MTNVSFNLIQSIYLIKTIKMTAKNKKDSQLDSIVEKGYRLKEMLNNYQSNSDSLKDANYPGASSLKPKPDLNFYDSISKVDVMKYSLDQLQVSQSQKEEQKNEEEEPKGGEVSVSHSLSYSNTSHSALDIKKFQNLNLTFNKLTFEDAKCDALKCLLYFECRIPLFKRQNDELFYDTFKVHIQGCPQGNVIQLDQMSYHKLNLESDSFSALANSAITITLYRIDTKTNLEAVVGTCVLDFNQIICAREFCYSGALDLVFIKDQKKPSDKKTQGKKQKDIKAKPTKVAKLDLACSLQKNKKKENWASNEMEEDKGEELLQLQEQSNQLESKPRHIQQSSDSNQYPNQVLIKSSQEEMANEIEEIRTDMFDEILVIYLNISQLNIANNSASIIASHKSKGQSGEFGFDSLKRNYFLMHKVFPDMNLACSDIMWESAKPNFRYSIQMPFTLNQANAELLDNGLFVIELWNKGIEDDELVGVVKFELRAFLEALKVDDTTISTQQLTRNTFPMVLYDNFYPINAYDTVNETGSVFLKILMAIGSPIQINNFVTKNQRERLSEEIELNKQSAGMSNSQQNRADVKASDGKENAMKPSKPKPIKDEEEDADEDRLDPFKVPEKKDKDNERSYRQENCKREQLNKSQQEKSRREYENYSKQEENSKRHQSRDDKEHNHNNSSKALDINVEELFEKNKREMEALNTKYELLPNNTFKQSASSTFDARKDVINPFLVPNEKPFEHPPSKREEDKIKEVPQHTQISKGDNFGIIDNTNDPHQLKSSEISQIKPQQEEESNLQPKKSFTNPLYNNTDPRVGGGQHVHTDVNPIKNLNPSPEDLKFSSSNVKSEPSPFINNALSIERNDLFENSQNKPQETDLTKKKSINNKLNMPIVRHIFDIQIDKLINVQVLSKMKGAYLRYKFFTDQSPLRSETLLYSSFNLDSSTIDVDMKSTHSIILSTQDKLKEYLSDFVIELMHANDSNEHIVIGKVNIPVEELFYLITDTPSMSRMLFVYGTEHIKRSECIIGKVKMAMHYSTEVEHSNCNDIFIEKQTIYNRKIPKNCLFKLTTQSFKHFSLFEDYYRKDFSYYFIISPFAEASSLEKTLGKRYTNKKYNVLSSEVNETVVYKLNIDQELIDYLKSRNCYVYLVYKTYSKRVPNSGSDSEKEDIDLVSSAMTGGNEKRIIGKGVIGLSDVLTSSDSFIKSIPIKQIDNSSGCLGELTMQFSLENANDLQQEQPISPKQTAKLKQCLLSSRNNSSRYLNGKFLFAIRFDRIIHQLPNLFGEVYFTFKLGKNLKKVSPKFSTEDSQDNEDVIRLSSNTSIILLNYNELFELDLNFSKKLPYDLYTQFTEGVLEIKLFNGDDSSLGNFYLDLSKLILSDFYSDNILFSGENAIKLTELKSNASKELKLQIDCCLIKMDDEVNNADYYQSLFSYDMIKALTSLNASSASDVNYVKELLQVNSIDFFAFINDNIINLNDIRGNFNLEEFKKLFFFITKLNYDLFAYYQSNSEQLAQCDISAVLDKQYSVSSVDNNDVNMLNFIKSQSDRVNIAIAHNTKALTTACPKPKFVFDALDYCLWAQSYQMHLLSLKNEASSSVIPASAFKKLFITVYSGMNITKCNCELKDRPNSFFILNFDDKSYKSEVIMKSSHPSWNEELEIKVPYSDYENKISAVPLVISLYSQEDADNAELIGKVEIEMSKLFPFLNEENECEDFYLVTNNGAVQGQLNLRIKFDEMKNLPQAQAKSQLFMEKVNQTHTDSRAYNNRKAYSPSNVFQKGVRVKGEEVDTETLRMRLEDAINTVTNLQYELSNPLIANDFNRNDQNNLVFNDIQKEFDTKEDQRLPHTKDIGNLSQCFDDNEDKRLNISNHSLANDREKRALNSQRPPLMNHIYKNANRNLLNHIEKIMKGTK